MIWSPHTPAQKRRTVLVLDCLEDRFAPAVLTVLEPIAAPAFSFASTSQIAIAPAASSDAVPFGFFHQFSQVAFCGAEEMLEEPATPTPPPVLPPLVLDIAPSLPEIADPPAAAVTPAPMPPAAAIPILAPVAIETPMPVVIPPPAPVSPPIAEAEPLREPIAEAFTAPARTTSRHGFAAVGGMLAAASLLYVNHAKNRRDEHQALTQAPR